MLAIFMVREKNTQEWLLDFWLEWMDCWNNFTKMETITGENDWGERMKREEIILRRQLNTDDVRVPG